MLTATVIKGCEKMLTAKEVSEVLGKPVKWVRDELLCTGILKGIKLGGNSWRVRPSELNRYTGSSATGFKHETPSGRWHGAGSRLREEADGVCT